MIIIVIIVAALLLILLIWLLISLRYAHAHRADECRLREFLSGMFKRFGIAVDLSEFERSYIRSYDGTCLALYVLTARPGAPVYVFMPGTAVYAEMYAQLLVDIHRRGFTVVGYDPRGHGRSGRLRGRFTVGQLIRDAQTVVAYARERFGTRVAFSGSSQGGVISLYLAATGDPNVATVVCHNIAYLDGKTIFEISTIKPPLWAVRPLLALFRAMAPFILPVTFYLPFYRLKLPDGSSAVELMKLDPLATPAYAMGAMATLAKTEPEIPFARMTIPVMVLSSGGDEVFPISYEKRIFAMLGCPKHFEDVPDLPHLMIMKPPEGVVDAIAAWLHRHIGIPGETGGAAVVPIPPSGDVR